MLGPFVDHSDSLEGVLTLATGQVQVALDELLLEFRAVETQVRLRLLACKIAFALRLILASISELDA